MPQLATTLPGGPVSTGRQNTAGQTKRREHPLVARIIAEHEEMGKDPIGRDLLFIHELGGAAARFGHKLIPHEGNERREYFRAVRKHIERTYKIDHGELNQLIMIYREPNVGPHKTRNRLINRMAEISN